MYHAIYPGKVWLDTEGKRIQAHGGSVMYWDGIYYWYGENKEKRRGIMISGIGASGVILPQICITGKTKDSSFRQNRMTPILHCIHQHRWTVLILFIIRQPGNSFVG